MSGLRSRAWLAGPSSLRLPRRSPGTDVLYRLLRRKPAIFGLVVIALFTLVALFAPKLAPHDPVALAFIQIVAVVPKETYRLSR